MMADSRAMRRLLRVLEIEEEQYRAALDSALGELQRLEGALEATTDQEQKGRQFVLLSAATGELADRLAGLEESHRARLRAAMLTPRIAQSELEVSERRREFLLKRLEKRKAETVIRKTEAENAIVEDRRGQRGLDDWFLARMRRNRDA
jgi:hypothetical protein